MATKSETPNLRQQGYARIKEALFSGRIKPGDFLSQREICEMVGIPLGPVREALKALESEQIVEVLPKRGIKVAQLDLKTFSKAIEARKLIEGKAAAHFASEAPMDLILSLKQETSDFYNSYKLIEHPDDSLFRERNRIDFLLHDTLVGFLDIPVLTNALKQATEQVRIFRFTLAAKDQFFELPAIHEHLAILDAIEKRDAAGAKAQMELHLQGTLSRALNV